MSNQTFWIMIIVAGILGIASFIYTVDKCGTKAILLGDSAFYAAYSGMCD